MTIAAAIFRPAPWNLGTTDLPPPQAVKGRRGLRSIAQVCRLGGSRPRARSRHPRWTSPIWGGNPSGGAAPRVAGYPPLSGGGRAAPHVPPAPAEPVSDCDRDRTCAVHAPP